jgi:predicted nucleic acid-binding protein
MSASFFDTNILLYASSADPIKASRADTLIAAGGVISVQVLNEFVRVAHGKLKRPWTDTLGYLTAARHLLKVQPLTLDVHDTGLRVAERYNLHIYDAMIAAAALEAGCDTLWSEDMHDGLVIDGKLTVSNPFATP